MIKEENQIRFIITLSFSRVVIKYRRSSQFGIRINDVRLRKIMVVDNVQETPWLVTVKFSSSKTSPRKTMTMTENFTKKLALAVRSIQWSYAIFWSISSTQPGTIEWEDGHYNGDIKTRKTIQSLELEEDELGLQRSEQLRKLYEWLSGGEASPQGKRPSTSLSPEDLTDPEWYYLVCMSFTFNFGQGLPGRTLESGEILWLSNAHFAESTVFSRSLLAKSASIKTIACFPLLSGVVEIGVTKLIMEDASLMQHIRTSFLEIAADPGATCAVFGYLITGYEELDLSSLRNSCRREQAEDALMANGANNGGRFEAQSWQFTEDDFSNIMHHSMNSSDRISQTIADPLKSFHVPEDAKLTSAELRIDDFHYQSVLSSVLKSTNPLIWGPNFHNIHGKSSFTGWQKRESMHLSRSGIRTQQQLLKKMLFDVPRMPRFFSQGKNNNGGARSTEENQKLNERFSILRSMVPTINKVDKVSILDDAIQYLRQLESKVCKLESFKGLSESEPRREKIQTGHEQTPLIHKRKACDLEEVEPEIEYDNAVGVGLHDITVITKEEDVLIEIQCLWKEGILLEILDAVSHLYLDSYSIQSSTLNGILSLSIKSKQTGLTTMTPRSIELALQRVGWRSLWMSKSM